MFLKKRFQSCAWLGEPYLVGQVAPEQWSRDRKRSANFPDFSLDSAAYLGSTYICNLQSAL